MASRYGRMTVDEHPHRMRSFGRQLVNLERTQECDGGVRHTLGDLGKRV